MLLTLLTLAGATTRTVYSDLQAIVDIAADGDTLELTQDIDATEIVTIDGLELEIKPSSSGPASPTIPPLYLKNGAELRLSDVSIYGGDFDSDSDLLYGGTLLMTDATATLETVNLYPGNGWMGIYAVDSVLDLSETTITDGHTSVRVEGTGEVRIDQAVISGGNSDTAPLMFDGSTGALSVEIQDSALSDLTGYYAGALYANTLVELRVSNTTLNTSLGTAASGVGIGAFKLVETDVVFDGVSVDTASLYTDPDNLAGVVAVFGGSFTSTNSSYVRTACTDCESGVLYAEDASVSLTGDSFYDGYGYPATYEFILVSGGSISIEDSSFDRTTGSSDGIGIFDASSFYLVDSTITHTLSGNVVDVVTGNVGSVVISGLSADGAGGESLGDFSAGTIQVLDSFITGYDGNSDGSNGVLMTFSEPDAVTLTRNRLCGMDYGRTTSMLTFESVAAGNPVTLQNNVFDGNDFGALLTLSGGEVTINNNTFLDNAGQSPLQGEPESLELVNNIAIGFTAPFVGSYGLSVDGHHNLVDGGDMTSVPENYDGTGDITTSDAGFWDGYVACDPGQAGIPYVAWGSAAIDVGSSSILDPAFPGRAADVSDIGATGGPDADGWMPPPDQDGDGAEVDIDCDDHDPSVGVELVGDGADNDCDGLIDEPADDSGDPGDSGPTDSVPGDSVSGDSVSGDSVPGDSVSDDSVPGDSVSGDTAPGDSVAAEDQDGDGYTTPEDCDDQNPAIFPGAEDVPDDDLDQDCDGLLAEQQLYGGGCRCDSGSAPVGRPGAAFALLFGLFALRRRGLRS